MPDVFFWQQSTQTKYSCILKYNKQCQHTVAAILAPELKMFHSANIRVDSHLRCP